MESQKFGRYEIKGEIGRGGMATVYHAYDPRFEREVALKVLPREMLHDPQFRTRFEREAKTIAMLEHPAIVPVYDFGEEDGQPFFVMRYMTGGALTDRMKAGAMPIPEAARLLERLAPALDEAHARGIIHRDLKPGNILFDTHDQPYISDFGIAKIAAAQTNVTGSSILGTPAYMSPEQAQGENIDGRSDIYGLGVILFEMLSGHQPYMGDTPMSVVIKHITDPVPHILDVKPDLPPEVEAVIEKAMAKDRDERFPTVKALAEALSQVAKGETPDLEPAAEAAAEAAARPSQTSVSKKPAAVKTTLISDKKQPPSGRSAEIPEPPGEPRQGKRKGLWIGLGGIAGLACLAVVAGIFIFKDQIPFLAGSQPTSTNTQAPIVQPATNTPQAPLLPAASETPTLTPTQEMSPTPTTKALAVIGGADLVAFLSNNDIWVMGVDGSDLLQLTRDGAQKRNLQWAPDGQSLFYISGKCIQSVTYPAGSASQVTCFASADFVEAFEFSHAGTQVAISVNRKVYVVPFDLAAISAARSTQALIDMKGCFTYGPPNQALSMDVKWSSDDKTLAINTKNPLGGVLVDEIHIFDIAACKSTDVYAQDSFPAARFTMNGYPAHPTIPSYTWDGDLLIVLNSIYRYEFGYLYEYNMTKRSARLIEPLSKPCCYTLGRYSPDTSHFLFAFQDIAEGPNAKTKLYLISYGSIGTGSTYTPFDLPADLFSNPNTHLDAAFRPAKP